jgi:hypothetical protein
MTMKIWIKDEIFPRAWLLALMLLPTQLLAQDIDRPHWTNGINCYNQDQSVCAVEELSLALQLENLTPENSVDALYKIAKSHLAMEEDAKAIESIIDIFKLQGSTYSCAKDEPDDFQKAYREARAKYEKMNDRTPPVLKHQALLKATMGNPIELKAMATDDRTLKSVVVNIRRSGEPKFETLPMPAGAEAGHFVVILPDRYSETGQNEYYLEAMDLSENVTPSGSRSQPHLMIVAPPLHINWPAWSSAGGAVVTGTLAGVFYVQAMGHASDAKDLKTMSIDEYNKLSIDDKNQYMNNIQDAEDKTDASYRNSLITLGVSAACIGAATYFFMTDTSSAASGKVAATTTPRFSFLADPNRGAYSLMFLRKF